MQPLALLLLALLACASLARPVVRTVRDAKQFDAMLEKHKTE
ncbi:hypothetical protein TeGR_g3081, partial [Tetraparma gracilis]